MTGSVSIIIPCYRQAHFLKDAIASALAQGNVEVVVVNDGSPDDTSRVAQEFGSAIRLVEQPNMGLSAARNSGIAASKGDYLLFLDADDYLFPGLLDGFATVLKVESKADLVCFGWSDTSPSGIVERTSSAPQWRDAFHQLLAINLMPCHTVLVRRAILQGIGLFDTHLRSCEDWDLWLRAAAAGAKFVRMEGVYAAYRRSAGTMSGNGLRMYESGMAVLAKNRRHPGCRQCYEATEQAREHFRWRFMSFYFRPSYSAARGKLERLKLLGGAARRVVTDPALLRPVVSTIWHC